MAQAVYKKHTPWEDKFQKPTFEDLRSSYNKQLGGLFETARERLLKRCPVETIVWHSPPWRWAIEYRENAEDERAAAFLIADTEAPRLGAPLPADFADATVANKKVKRAVADVISGGKLVLGIRWVDWQVLNKTSLDDVMQVIERYFALGDAPEKTSKKK